MKKKYIHTKEEILKAIYDGKPIYDKYGRPSVYMSGTLITAPNVRLSTANLVSETLATDKDEIYILTDEDRTYLNNAEDVIDALKRGKTVFEEDWDLIYTLRNGIVYATDPTGSHVINPTMDLRKSQYYIKE